MEENKALNIEELDDVAGGNDGVAKAKWSWVKANVQTGYLALRSKPAYAYENEIAKIQDGTVFQVRKEKKSGNYVWAKFNGMEGWTDSRYIKSVKISS